MVNASSTLDACLIADLSAGNAINRKEQIDLTHTVTKAVELHHGGTMIGAGGLFAPTIRHHQGVFYIVCTNVGEEGEDFNAENFYISTTNIWQGVWSDPKSLDFRGIDPSLFIDDDGRAYIQGAWRLDRSEQPYSTIKQYEIDLETGKRLSDVVELWPGSAQVYTEGPHVYKKDSVYYLLVAEGGTFEHHMLSIGRSRSIWGPYEDCPQNPILTSYGKPGESVQDAGHGELFQDGYGLWWATVLGVRKVDDRYPLGRESFLTPVEWPEGDWPCIKHPQAHFEREVPTRTNWTCLPQRPRVDDCFIRNPEAEDYILSDKTIKLNPSRNSLAVSIGTTSFVGKRQRAIASRFTATIAPSEKDMGRSVLAGLAVYKDDFRSASIAVDFGKSAILVRQRRVAEAGLAEDVIVAKVRLPISPVHLVQLSIETSQEAYDFQYRLHPADRYTSLGLVDAIDMTGRDFTGTILGVFAHHTTEEIASQGWVSFENVTTAAS